MLENEYELAKIGADTAENEPLEIAKCGCRPTAEVLVRQLRRALGRTMPFQKSLSRISSAELSLRSHKESQ